MTDVVQFEFSHNGQGMNDEQAGILFGGVTSEPDGLGLGLRLCRELCQQMGAEVSPGPHGARDWLQHCRHGAAD